MTINENDRLDLRQELERIFADKRLADIAMEAMPPIDYEQLATRAGLEILRGEMSGLRGELKSDIANNLRVMLAAQLTTMMMLGAWVAAIS